MIEGEQSGGGDDGHLRAAAVTDTFLPDFIFSAERKKVRPPDEGKKKKKATFDFAAVQLEVGMRFFGKKHFASAVGLVLGLLCAVKAAKGN